jgi:hypothetical protein
VPPRTCSYSPRAGYQAHAYRLLDEIAGRCEPPDVDQATLHYRQALALAELSAAIDLYRAMDMTFWLPQAEAVLAQKLERR